MFSKATKKILMIATGAVALMASPANAGTLITYYGWAGGWQIDGYQLYCDSGAMYSYWGGVTPDYSTSYVSLPDC
jgi:hypothetical protein